MEKAEEPKKKNIFKVILIIIIVFILIPLSIGSLVYFNNKSFKNKVNSILTKAPGSIGEYFKNCPTENERNDKEIYLADYYLSLDSERAADKIYIIKKNDEELFNDIIKLMNSMSSKKTTEVLKTIRNIELRKDLLFSIYDEIQEEKENELKDEVTRLEKDDILLNVNKIERYVNEDKNYIDSLPSIFNSMKEDKASQILYYINSNIKDRILIKLPRDKSNRLEASILKQEMNDRKCEDLGRIYEAKPIDVCIKEIGNNENYSMNELANIYMNLSIKKSADILSKVNNDDFVEGLFEFIRKEEQLKKKEKSLTVSISEAIKFISEYDRKIDELVEVYEKMSPDAVAKIVENMMNNTNKVTSLKIGSSPIYEISDSTIITDVLSRMNKVKLSKIMSNMETDKSSNLTKKFIKP